MDWFDQLFPPLMILSPALMSLAFRANREVEIDRSKVRRSTILLWLGTCIALVLARLAWLWPGAPWARFAWVLVAPLFPLLMPLLIAKNPDFNTQLAAGTVRSAPLGNRQRLQPVPSWWWLAGWAVWSACLICVLARLLTPGDPWASWPWPIALSVLATQGPILLGVGHWSVRMVLGESEPMDARNSPTLAREYEALRRARSRGIAAFALLMTLVTSVLALAFAWLEPTPIWGLYGGGLGAALGVGGAAFGTVCTVRRLQINSLLRRLSGENGISGPPGVTG